jgi:chemotaxis protein methyltransferase CheR
VSGLADVDFRALQQYLLDTAGLVFDESRRAGLASFVTERLRTTGSPGVATYLEWIRTEDGATERQHLLDGVTVQETHFFRNAPQMTALRRRVLPELLRRTAGRERPLTIWSAGCSTGEEPYSLAMMVLDLASPAAVLPPRIVATDVSAAALATARRATYAGRSLESAPVGMQERWFEPRHGAAMTVSPKVRALVDLRLHNLVTEEPPFDPGEVDLVVCRNVTIYFDRATTRRLVNTFHRVLAEGGYLLLGHSETLWQVSDDFTLVPVGDAFVYRRSHDSRQDAPSPRPVRSARGQGADTRTGARAVQPRAAGPSRAVAAAHPSPIADLNTALGEARAALAAGDYEGATRAGAAAVQEESLQPVAYVVLGRALTATGQDAAAADVLRKAVYLDPTAGDAHFLLAGALSRQGLHGSAAVSYRAAAKTLHRVPSTVLDDLFGGRALSELVDLCHQLAGDSDERAQSAPVAAGGTT